MAERIFKTVVFFGTNFPQYSLIKEALSIYPRLNVFQTVHAEEVNQILHQSNLTAIIINDKLCAKMLEGMEILDFKEAGVRTYFLDPNSSQTRDEINEMSFKRISTLRNISNEELKSKLEIFLLGKHRLNQDESKEEPLKVPVYPRPVYFTHYKRGKYFWDLIVSTHEQEREIEVVFGRSWAVFTIDLLERADAIQKVELDPNFSDLYYGIIYPNSKNGTLSVIHVKKDHPDFEAVVKKSIDFLSKL